MLSFSWLTIFFLPYFCTASDVLVFTDSDFKSNVQQHDIILVEFYAPWCGHCKALAPKYEEAATQLRRNDPPIPLAKVDCTSETETCKEFGVQGYPTLKVFKNGKFAFEYGGGRDTEGIVSYMISKSGPSSYEMKDSDGLESFISKATKPVIVGFFQDSKSNFATTFQNIADKLNEDFRFAHTFSADVGSKYEAKEDTVFIFYPKSQQNKFEPAKVKYEGDADNSKLTKFIEENSMGLAGVRSQATQKFFSSRPLLIAFYEFDFVLNPKQANYVRNRVLKAITTLDNSGAGNLKAAVSNSKELQYELAEFGVDQPDSSKVYIVLRDEKEQKYRMEGDFSIQAVQQFLTDFSAGKLTPYLKSEPVPEKAKEGEVQVVVAKNFEEIVNDPTKDVLIEFYAPWCGHCKALAPKYDELAKKLSGEKEIVIAKLDATANDIPPQYEVRGYPTIYFAPQGDKQNPKSYDGEREVDGFVRYLAKHSTKPLSGFERSGSPRKTDL